MSFNGLEGCRDEPCPCRLPSQSRPSPPSLLAPRGREAGVGERVASPVQFNPVPSAVPFNESVRTGTLVRRKSLPGIDYGRTTSIGPEETGPGTEGGSRLCRPFGIRVPSHPLVDPTLDFGVGTLDSPAPCRRVSRPSPDKTRIPSLVPSRRVAAKVSQTDSRSVSAERRGIGAPAFVPFGRAHSYCPRVRIWN
jgi:hypothetical protein